MLVVGVDRALPEGGAGLSEAHVLSYNYVGELEPVQCNSELVAVADSGGAAIRTVRKRRRKEKLESYWYCQYCKKYNERAVDLEKCRACGVPIQGPGASVAEAERKRLQSREKRLKGRELNSAGAGLAAVVERGWSGIFDEETRREAVVAETRGLQRAIGNPRTLASEDQKMAIIDGFLLVHYKGAHSVHPSANATAGIDGSVVADFLNLLGRRASNGEEVHPMGGYFNLFLQEAVGAGLLRDLQHIAITKLGASANEVTKNGSTFKDWYKSDEGQKSECYEMLRKRVAVQLQRFCASLYEPNGRLGYALARNGGGAAQPKPDDFRVRWLPPMVVHQLLYRLFSITTQKFLKDRTSTVLNCAKGFVTETDSVSNQAQIYTGNYILQLSKAFSVYLRAGNAGCDATEERLACDARYSAVKNATLLRKLRSKAVVDDIFVDAVAPLDLRYSWDQTLFAAMCDAESLALRRMEVYQQDHGDCVMVALGEEVTLPKTKADQLSEGVKRLKSHASKCPCAGGVESFSMESACKRSSDGKTLIGGFRCGVCAKRLLFATQGDRPADEPRPSFIRLSRRAKPSWMDKDRDTPNAKTASPEDFVFGEATPYEEFACA